jgi:hypothetical protein
MQHVGYGVPRIHLPGTSVNKGIKKIRDGRLRNTTNADASKKKGHKIRAAS